MDLLANSCQRLALKGQVSKQAAVNTGVLYSSTANALNYDLLKVYNRA